MCHLEEEALVENRFANPFRTRDTWALDEKGTSLERDTEKANVLGGVYSADGKRGHDK